MSDFKPDYEDKCDNCGQSLTVTASTTPSEECHDGVVRWYMCGPCMLGEARMIDLEEWIND